MRGQRTAGSRRALRALALLLALAVGFGALGHATTGHATKHASRVAAALAITAGDVQHGTVDLDHGAAPARLTTGATADTTRDSSPSVSSRTAHTPQVRGPPGQSSA